MFPIDFGVNQIKVKVKVTDKAAWGRGVCPVLQTDYYFGYCLGKVGHYISTSISTRGKATIR